jgi:putative membrane protein
MSVMADAAAAAAQGWMQHMSDGMMHGWWGFGMILWLLFWLALIALVAVVIWRLVRGGPILGGREESPLEILKRRYARGEIDREEFETKRRDLGYG